MTTDQPSIIGVNEILKKVAAIFGRPGINGEDAYVAIIMLSAESIRACGAPREENIDIFVSKIRAYLDHIPDA